MEIENLFARVPDAATAEHFATLFGRRGMRLERIVSHGQATPVDAPMVQDHDEWVVVLAGEAGLRIGDGPEVTLRPGDHLTIAAGERHWVTRTSSPTVWLALHVAADS